MPSPNLDSLSPLAQIFILVASAVAGGAAWLFGARNQSNDGTADHSFIELANEKLRRDLTEVLTRHREAIDNRIMQQSDGMRLSLDQFNGRLQSIEVSIARLEVISERRE